MLGPVGADTGFCYVAVLGRGGRLRIRGPVMWQLWGRGVEIQGIVDVAVLGPGGENTGWQFWGRRGVRIRDFVMWQFWERGLRIRGCVMWQFFVGGG